MKAKKQTFSRLKTWCKKHPRWTLIIAGLILIVVTAGVAWYLYAKTPEPQVNIGPTPVREEPEEDTVYYAPLTGIEVEGPSDETKPVTTVMIENSPNARPQSGLAEAEVVYEAIAEGGVTRFMSIYQQDIPELIGPVRSLRMYYVDWLAPYDTSVAHVGGSAASRAEIGNGNYRTLDEFANPGGYWRANDRYAPHNLYTSGERLKALNTAKSYESSKPEVFTRKDSEPSDNPNATQIHVTMSGLLYDSSYTYNQEANTYTRSQAGQPHIDREKGAISPRVVVVIEAATQTVQEDGMRERYQTTGSGPVSIFQDGEVLQGTWNKENRDSQYTFLDEEGETMELARGQTWISIVPTGRGGVTWQ